MQAGRSFSINLLFSPRLKRLFFGRSAASTTKINRLPDNKTASLCDHKPAIYRVTPLFVTAERYILAQAVQNRCKHQQLVYNAEPNAAKLQSNWLLLPGEMSEWSKEHAWKVCVPHGTEGSNPSLSATLSY